MARRKSTDRQVEDALFRRACGYQAQETTVEEKKDREGNPYTLTKTVSKDVPPHPASAIFWLTNRCPERWQYRPEGGEKDDAEGEGVIVLPPVIEPPAPPEEEGEK